MKILDKMENVLDQACKTKTHKIYYTQPVKQRHTKCIRPSLKNKDTQNPQLSLAINPRRQCTYHQPGGENFYNLE